MEEAKESWFMRMAPYIINYVTTRQLVGALVTLAVILGALAGYYAITGYIGFAWALGIPAVAMVILCAVILWSGWERFEA